MEKGLAHSHVLGLGVDKGMNIVEGSGLFGMESARKGASIFSDMVLQKKIAGSALLITGESGVGKTALAVALSKELGSRVPFVKMVGSEVYSAEIRKTEILHQALRRAISVRIREIKQVYEGEIFDLKFEEKEDPLNNYRKTVAKVHITLKSGKGSQRLTFPSIFAHSITKQKIATGDVVYIEAESSIIRKIGRSETYASEFDIESDKYVPMPKGEIFTKKEVLQEMTLHEIDMANTKPKGEDTVSLLSQISRPGKTEVPRRIREEVNERISRYLSTGSAEITPGVLFIDESHTLDQECFSFLGTMMESPLSPIIVFATNKKIAKVFGARENKESLFGMPEEFLNRLFITKIIPQTEEEIEKIVKEKVKTETKNGDLKIEEEAISFLCELSKKTSIRFAFNLLPLAQTYTEEKATKRALEEVASLFSTE